MTDDDLRWWVQRYPDNRARIRGRQNYGRLTAPGDQAIVLIDQHETYQRIADVSCLELICNGRYAAAASVVDQSPDLFVPDDSYGVRARRLPLSG